MANSPDLNAYQLGMRYRLDCYGMQPLYVRTLADIGSVYREFPTAKFAVKNLDLKELIMTLQQIEIPPEYIDLCREWHGGLDCMLYAIASTGDLSLGDIRPINDDTGQPMTDPEWHLHLWECLECDVRHCKSPELSEFLAFCEKTVSDLRIAYNL